MFNYLTGLKPAFTYKDKNLYIEQVSYKKILNKFPSPIMIYSKKRLLDNLKSIKDGFKKYYPKTHIKAYGFYSLKACYVPEVLKTFYDAGIGVEVMSMQEYKLARKIGWDPEKIIWNSPGKTNEELEIIAKDGVSQVNIDSESELFRLNKIAKRFLKVINIGIRIRPDFNGEISKFASRGNRLGLDSRSNAAWKICRLASSLDSIRLVGLHSHVLICKDNAESHKRLSKFMCTFTQKLQNELGIRLEYINLGGGFNSRSQIERNDANFCDFAEAILGQLNTLDYQPQVILEVGRYLVNDAALAISKVITKKKDVGINWLIVDIGTNVLVPLAHADFKTVPVNIRNNAKNRLKKFSVGDSLCSFGGVIEKDAFLPEIFEGDYIAISNCGAYTVSMASGFGKSIPKILFVDKNKIREIKL